MAAPEAITLQHSDSLAVAMEARRLQDRPLGGVGRMLSNLLPHLSQLVPVTLVLDARSAPVPPLAPVVSLGAPRRVPGSLWLQAAVGRWARGALRAEGSVFHGTFNAIPVRLPCPAVVTIYDLSFEVHPEDFGSAKRRLFQLQARWAARHAARILTISTFSHDQIVEHYRVPPERIVVTRPAADPVFAPTRAHHAPAVARSLGIDGPYLVTIGGARRRGADVAVAAWRAVRSEGYDVALVVLGGGVDPAAGLHVARDLDDERWAALLAGADCLVYPTRYEGFGLPALEAAASGTPVVCAPVGPLPEVLGDAALWCAEPSPEAVAAGVVRVLADHDLAGALRRAGLARAAAASWADAAERTAAAYAEALIDR